MSSPKLILALSGWAGSGKDTAAAALEEFLGFRRLAFADALKHNTAVQFGLSIENFHDRDLKDAPIPQLPISEEARKELPTTVEGLDYWTPRALMMLEGNMKRSVDPEYWVRLLFTPMFAAEQLGLSLFALTDWRFPNEIVSIRKIYPEYEVVTIKIDRFDHAPSTNICDTALNDAEFDHIIVNRGTEKKFIANVTSLAGELLNERRSIKS